MIGNGQCGGHNVKLVGQVTEKKMSVIDKTGKLSWTMREVTVLTCPVAHLTHSLPDSQVSMETPNLSELSTARLKKFKISDSEVDQSTEHNPIQRMKH